MTVAGMVAALRRKSENQYYTFANETIFTRLRLAIHLGEIRVPQIVFVFDHQHLHPDVHGRLKEWPEGFADISEAWLRALLLPQSEVQHAAD